MSNEYNVNFQKKANDSLSFYLNDIKDHPLLSKEEEIDLFISFNNGDQNAKKKLIESNLKLVISVAKEYTNRGIALGDLIAEGNLGLIHAIEKFDVSRKNKLSTYAPFWIRHNIERAIMNQSRTVRLPVHVIKELTIVLKKEKELFQKNNEVPSPELIAQELDKTVERVQELLDFNTSTSSLDNAIYDDSEKSYGDMFFDEASETPYSSLESENIEYKMKDLLGRLNERQGEIIARRFGLLGYEASTFEEIGDVIDLTRERVRQLHNDALVKLQTMIKNEGASIDDFLQMA